MTKDANRLLNFSDCCIIELFKQDSIYCWFAGQPWRISTPLLSSLLRFVVISLVCKLRPHSVAVGLFSQENGGFNTCSLLDPLPFIDIPSCLLSSNLRSNFHRLSLSLENTWGWCPWSFWKEMFNVFSRENKYQRNPASETGLSPRCSSPKLLSNMT